MKNIIFYLLFLCSSWVFAQESDITITGVVIDNDTGEPVIGVTISEVGEKNGNGTITDYDGRFSLKLKSKMEATVSVAYIGYGSAKIKISKSEYWQVLMDENGTHVIRNSLLDKENLAPIKLSSLLRNEKDGLGVAYLTNDMPQSYFGENLYNIDNFKSSGKRIVLKKTKIKRYRSGHNVDFTSSIDFSTIGRQPKWQSEFTQGQEGKWLIQDELFSWGASINDIKNAGKNITVYSPDNFFRTGVSFGNSVNIKTPIFNNTGFTNITLGQKKENSPIPLSYKEQYNASLDMKEILTGRFKSDVGIFYNTSYGKLTQQGSNIATLMHSIYTTPPTYDNSNGVSKTNKNAWLNENGSYRSYDPSSVNNPYALINELPDREKNEYLMTYIKTKYEYDEIVWSNNLSYDKQWNSFNNGTLPHISAPRNSIRKDQTANILFNTSFKYYLHKYRPNKSFNLMYDFKHTSDKVDQKNTYLNQIPNSYNKQLIRNSHSLRYSFEIDNNKLRFEIANRHYFSNTMNTDDFKNLFPELGFNLKLNRIFEDLFNNYNNNIVLYGNIKRSVGEVSLIDRSPSVLSTTLEAKNFRNYYEYQLPIYNKNLKPETLVGGELGFRFDRNYNRFSFDINAYNYHTHDLILSRIDNNNNPILSNVGRMRNYGYFIELSYSPKLYGWGNDWGINLQYTFSQGKTKVTALYSDQQFLRLAGFTDIATVFAENDPLGAIYGTTYMRDDDGEIIVGEDGFPMVNSKLSKIGDPTPDFKMTLNPNIYYNKFSLSFCLEYSQGGDKWNGTKAFMDYQGVSENSAKNRNIRGYIFQGVDLSGNQNTKTVDFFNTSAPTLQNRWSRYGMAGIGEENIEKATYLRLSNITLRYTNNRIYNKVIKNISVSLSANNLFLITAYKGVDPSTEMFGYSLAKGLDLFNSPSLRSYSLIVTLGF